MLSPPAALADSGSTLARLKAGVQAERDALQRRFRETADGTMVLREHRRLVDRVLKDMWRQLQVPAPLALLAVGGYGRGSFSPIPTSTCWYCCRIRLPPIWRPRSRTRRTGLDTGLELAHSVRTVAECVEEATRT